jgi:hypothetical protein
MLYDLNCGVPKLGLIPIEIFCKEQGHSSVVPFEGIDEIKPFFRDKNISSFWNGFEQFEPLWLCSIQLSMISGRNHLIQTSSAGNVGPNVCVNLIYFTTCNDNYP